VLTGVALGAVVTTAFITDLARFLTAGYAGVSVPVVGLAPALQQLSPRVTLLIFALAVGRGIIGSALRQAQAAADDKIVTVRGGADLGRQYLAAGLVDEIQVHLAPVLFGSGTPMFQSLDMGHVQLELGETIEPSLAVHLATASSRTGDQMDDLDAHARALIDANPYMTLGTADADGIPWVSPVYFAADDYAELYWESATDATHSRSIAQRPRVSVVIFDSQVPTYHAHAVYLSATATELAGRDLDRGLGI
jgi:hypothetical protein